MSYYVRPATQPRLHTLTRLENMDPWAAFRSACEGGGTPPAWTRSGDDPQDWAAPSDAAGGLVLWCADGSLWRVEPQRAEAEEIAADALLDLRAAWDWPDDYYARAVYFSSGGRAVLLLDPVASGTWIVAVFRCEDTPRSGASEANIVGIQSGTCVVEVKK